VSQEETVPSNPDEPRPATAPQPGVTASSDGGTGRRTRRGLLLAIGSLLALGVIGLAYWFFFVRGIVYSDDARIDGTLVDVAPRIQGVILALHAMEGETVARGQTLFELDDTTLVVALERARADVAAAAANLAVANAANAKALHGPRAAEIRIALAAKESADASVHLAISEWERARALSDKHMLSGAERLRVQTALEQAKKTQAEAADRLRLLDEGTRSEDMAGARANVERAQADLAAARASETQAQVNLDYAKVHAPFAGTVVRKWRDAGATVAAGTPVLTILDPSSLHVSANIDEKDLAEVAVGDRVDVSIDAYSGVRLTGRVQAILRATNSQFGLIPSEGVSGTFIKVAQRVPLRITLDHPHAPLDLGPGLSVEIKIRKGSATKQQPAEASRE